MPFIYIYIYIHFIYHDMPRIPFHKYPVFVTIRGLQLDPSPWARTNQRWKPWARRIILHDGYATCINNIVYIYIYKSRYRTKLTEATTIGIISLIDYLSFMISIFSPSLSVTSPQKGADQPARAPHIVILRDLPKTLKPLDISHPSWSLQLWQFTRLEPMRSMTQWDFPNRPSKAWHLFPTSNFLATPDLIIYVSPHETPNRSMRICSMGPGDLFQLGVSHVPFMECWNQPLFFTRDHQSLF